MEKDNNVQVGGNHYSCNIPPIDYIHANCLNFDEGNVVKYITRHADKNGVHDLAKCVHYVLFEMEHEYGFPPSLIDAIMSSINVWLYDSRPEDGVQTP